jgi:predicted dehydrogenase
MGTTHASAWATTPAEVVGVYSTNGLERIDGLKIFPSYAALLEAVDVVDICTPTPTHHDLVIQAAQANKHIICEKPLARTLAEGQAMLAACQAAGVHLLVAHVVRFFPEYAQAKATVERGEIGQVAVIRLTRASFRPSTPWINDPEQSGGLLLDMMIHDFDYARWVAGEVESVFAKHVHAKQPNAVGDYALAILKHRDGALSHVEGGWAYPKPMFRTALEIAGSQGLIEQPADLATPLKTYWHKTEQGDEPEIAVPGSPLAEDPYATQLKHFYEVLVNGAPMRVTPQDGLAALHISLAAIQSAQTGRRVALTEVH